MKFGVRLYGAEADAIVAKAVRAEELGFESLWRGDHLILPTTTGSAYPYSTQGCPPFAADAPVLDVLTVLSYVAAATTTIRLATGVLVLPLREVFALARAVQTVDILSRGRLTVGVGVGWLEEEFDVVGRDFHRRGKIATEVIGVLRTLFTDPEPAFVGRHLRVGGVRFEPKPVQRPIPIVAGGESDAALHRAAALCDGWYGHVCTPAEAGRFVRSLQARRAEAGRSDEPFEVTVRVDPSLSRDAVGRFADVGVARIVAEIGSFDEARGLDDLQRMEDFAERVMSPAAET